MNQAISGSFTHPEVATDWRRELLLTALKAAVPIEMSRVTEASMDLLLADRDRWLVLNQRADAVMRQIKDLHATAKDRDPNGELTEAELAKLDALAGEHKELCRQMDSETALGLMAGRADNILYGGKDCAKIFDVLARTLAHMAYQPGGVTFAKVHWCAWDHRYGFDGLPPLDAQCETAGSRKVASS